MKKNLTQIKNYFGFENFEEDSNPSFSMPKDEQIRRWKQVAVDQQAQITAKDRTILALSEEVARLNRVNECQADLLEGKWGLNG